MSYELTDRQKIICGMALGQWGWRKQMMKVAEELSELAVAIVDAVEKAKPNEELERALVDERADVAIVLYQFDTLLTDEAFTAKVARRINAKGARLAERVFMDAAKEEAK